MEADTTLIPPRKTGKPRPVRVVGSVAFVPLSDGSEALLDLADVPLVERRSWHTDTRSETLKYPRCSIDLNGVSRKIRMHNVILPAIEGMVVDHINGNGLDNRRENLRYVTKSKNVRNSRTRRDGHVPNVRRHQRTGMYASYVCVGWFKDKEDAKRAVVEAERQLGLQ